MTDKHDNTLAREGYDRCSCGCKYWEHDRCIDCNTHVNDISKDCLISDGIAGQQCLNPSKQRGLCAMHLEGED